MAAKKGAKEVSVVAEEVKATKRFSKKHKLVAALVVVVVLAFAGLLVNQMNTNSRLKKENQKLSNPQAAAQAETKQITAQVGKLIELPANETPTVATVVDATKLQKQAFFSSAKNGDRVLIYTQAKKAILYRPSINKVIQVAPVNIGNTQSSQSQP
jgi:predicted negative regulator of RcsB-dependent stress response